MTKNVMFGRVESFFTSCCVDIRHSMGKARSRSCRRLIYSRFNSIVSIEINIDAVWNKRSSKAKNLIQKMLSKRP